MSQATEKQREVAAIVHAVRGVALEMAMIAVGAMSLDDLFYIERVIAWR